MIVSVINEKIIRYTLGALFLLVALNAFAGGYYGMAGANNVPTEWLKGSPFQTYFIPGLILFLCVGNSSLIAAIAVFKTHPVARRISFIGGIIILGWLSVQIAIIGCVSWMQPATAAAAVFILLLTSLLLKQKL